MNAWPCFLACCESLLAEHAAKTEQITTVQPPYRPQAVDVDRRILSPGNSMRLLWSSVVFLWFGVGMVGIGYALALGSPSYPDYQLELFEKMFKRDPDLDNPMMLFPAQQSVVDICLKTVPYGIGAWLFTTCVAFLTLARGTYRILSFLLAVFFCCGCLLVAVELFESSRHSLKWHFFPLALGFFTVGACLCIGGVSALTACFAIELGRKIARRLFLSRVQ